MAAGVPPVSERDGAGRVEAAASFRTGRASAFDAFQIYRAALNAANEGGEVDRGAGASAIVPVAKNSTAKDEGHRVEAAPGLPL